MAALLKKCFRVEDFTQILLIGLDGAGKSTLMHRLKMPQWKLEKMVGTLNDLRQYKVWEPEESNPFDAKVNKPIQYTSLETGQKKLACIQEPGYNYEVFYDFGLWDIPGIVTDVLPSLWGLFYRAVKYHAVLYAISSADSERLAICKKHIFALLNEEELRDAAIVILINSRRENPYDASRDAFYYELELHKLPPNRVKKFVFDFAAVKGQRDPNMTQVLDFIKHRHKS